MRYQFFIKGELIDLCIPSKLAIEKDGWADWFNDIEKLQATEHGIYPNYIAAQQNILDSLASDRSKIVLLVCEKVGNKAIGVISLQNINLQNNSAEIALNVSSKNKSTINPLAALEAMALITQHGFDQLGLIRIYASQAFPLLKNWNKGLETIGYRSEGILKNSFIRGHSVYDTVAISCLYENYIKLKNLRGTLWGSAKIIRKTMKKQPKHSFANVISDHLKVNEEKYFEFLFSD